MSNVNSDYFEPLQTDYIHTGDMDRNDLKEVFGGFNGHD
jgi:hypothetical protein